MIKQLTTKIVSAVLVVSMCIAPAAQAATITQTTLLAGLYAASTDVLVDQLDELYHTVAEQFDIPYTYVKALHIVAGGKTMYADKRPKLYTDTTSQAFPGPFDIEGATQKYDRKAPFAYCADSSVERPSRYYLPDAAYSVTSEIVELMNARYTVDRGLMQEYFNALLPDVKMNIVFYEAVMEYCGYTPEQVNMLYKTYEQLLYKKEKDEYVVALTAVNEYEIKDKFRSIFYKNGITDLDILAKVMSFDKRLAECDTPDSLKSEIPLPYRLDYTSRENMMVAAMSIVGKVKYIWGGGHLGTGNISGISPIWSAFEEVYDTSDKSNRCIKPGSTWCPIHGDIGESDNGCAFEGGGISTIQEYLELRGNLLKTTKSYAKIEGKDLSKIFLNGSVAFTNYAGNKQSVAPHRLEGLDCSGFTSWLFNQIDSERIYDCGATAFITAGKLIELEWGSNLYPGDVITWGSHIIAVVGTLDDTWTTYLIVESAPNTVKLGVAYMPGATKEQLAEAKALASQANILLGNTGDEPINVFNLEGRRYSTTVVEDEETGEVSYNKTLVLHFGRLGRPFIDEFDTVDNTDKTMKQLVAKEIIQHTIDILPEEYLSGLEEYQSIPDEEKVLAVSY